MTLGQRIKKLRQDAGMTQEELAKMLGVTKAAVQKYENGSIDNPRREIIQKLCVIFNMPSYVFIYDEFPDVKEYNEVLLMRAYEVYGHATFQISNRFAQLNETGKQKVIEYAEDILKIEEYRK